MSSQKRLTRDYHSAYPKGTMTQPLWKIETVQRLMTLQAGKKRGLWLAASQRNWCSVQTQCKNEMVSHYDSHYHPAYPEAPCPVPVLIEGETSLLYQTLCDNLSCDNLSCTVLYFAGLSDDQPNGIIRPVLLPTNPSGFPQLPGDPHRGHIKSQRHHKAIPLPTNAQSLFAANGSLRETGKASGIMRPIFIVNGSARVSFSRRQNAAGYLVIFHAPYIVHEG